MAIILCPGCKEQVSDRATKCVHCGMVLLNEEKKKCEECGSELEEGTAVCSNCGCPVDTFENSDNEEKAQKVEVTGVKVSKRWKKIFVFLLALSIIGGATFVGVRQYQKKKAAERYAEIVSEYKAKLSLTLDTILIGAGSAERCGNKVKVVWQNAIFEDYDIETDKYTRPDGYFVNFNSALQNLYEDDNFKKNIDGIEKNQDTVNELMKTLKNPPAEYQEAYEKTNELYDSYFVLTNLAVSPTGNLQTYSNNFNDADMETEKCYKAMSKYLDD